MPNINIHGTRTKDGRVLGIQAFLVMQKLHGISLRIRPHSVSSCLIEKCIAFTNIMNLYGPFDIEFLYDSNSKQYFFLETNNRFGASTAKIFACGYDEPMYAMNAYGYSNELPVNRIKKFSSTSKMYLVKDMIYAFKGLLTPTDYPQLSTLQRLIYDIFGLMLLRDDVFYLRDLSGTYCMYKAALVRTRRSGEL